ncbi:leucine-rich repeat-containing protein 57-like [Ostrea edulis]|uniref:leucine-rich repeat-containing protein 57-like n=1 Tax=Ostrea edulis TaxID=37623 RepID=UPI002094313D|nr:leucine-rich repeat-containing protein 57-like [Ostrea edulis]
MGNSNVTQHIETAEKTGACQLCKAGLKEFPNDLNRLTKNLRTLDLSDNKLPGIPPSIGSFTLLKNLVLNRNKLEIIPDELGNLKKLECLSLDGNCLTRLPDSLSKLSNLRTLNVSENKITHFPQSLTTLKNLDAVNLSRNKITEIPDAVGTCQAIELNLNQNQISRLSESISQCPRLKVLRLEENCLDVSAFTPKVLKESKIALFSIEGNVFDMKTFHNLEGYEEYMERYTETKKKFN